MRKIFLMPPVLLLLISTVCCARGDEKKSKGDGTDPYNARNLSLFLSYGYDQSVTGFPIDLTAFYTGKHISLEACQSITSVFKPNSDTLKAYNIKPFNNTEFTCAYHFFQKKKHVTKVFVINSWVSGGMRYTQYGATGVTARQIYGVRGGIDMFNSNMKIALVDHRDQYINYQSGIMYVGLLSKRIINDRFKYAREFYFDLLFPSGTSADKPILPLSPGNDVNKAVNRSSGWRLGWMVHSDRIFGFYFRCDFGSMPGYQLQPGGNSTKSVFTSMYTAFTLGLGFSSGALKHSPI